VSLEGVVLRAFRAGARDFFRKPVNIPELKDTIEVLLSFRKSSQEKRSPFIKTAS
jgi:FixJ family two-component response regulator